MDRVSGASVLSSTDEIKETFQDIPYIKELLPKDLSAYTQEVKEKVALLIRDYQAEDGEKARLIWHQITETLQVAGTKLGYLIPTHFPEKKGEAGACIGELMQIKLPQPPEARPFTFLKGDASEKQGDKARLTTFNANILFMPDDYTWFFGGVSNWEKRKDAVANIILNVDADVVSLQEEHVTEGAIALYERLKGTYAYFYINVGQADHTQDLQSIRMNSGLFVASKYPIEGMNFVPYLVEGRQEGINKGFLEGTVMISGEPFCQLYHTHLNPFENETAYRVRKEEAELLVDSMEKKDLFSVALGDMNVNMGSKEWKNSPLSQKFICNYPPGEGATCTDTLGWIVERPQADRQGIEHEGHICDYALVYLKSSPVNIVSHQVKFYDLDVPEQAVSDHQGVFSIITK